MDIHDSHRVKHVRATQDDPARRDSTRYTGKSRVRGQGLAAEFTRRGALS